jgi:pimeloyl-ACP methyl ester carboxylesterase
MHYWLSILNILRKTVGAEVIVTAVPGTGSIASRAEQLDRFLQIKALGRGINFMAHSMGGLDCRYLITHLKPVDYTPLSLTTIATPHRGSPFMDWCKVRCMHHRYYDGSLLMSTLVIRSTSVWVVGVMEKEQSKCQFRQGLSLPSLWLRWAQEQSHRFLQVQDPTSHRHCLLPRFPRCHRRLRHIYLECSTRQRTPT